MSMTIYAELASHWPRDRYELFLERSAIMEYDGGMSRDDADFVVYNRMMLGAKNES